MIARSIDDWMIQAVAARECGEAERALQLLGKVLGQRPDFAPALHLSGVVMLDTGRGREALPYLRRAAVSMPHNADCLQALGICQSELNDVLGAERSFEAALTLRPHDSKLLLDLGSVLERRGRTEAAASRYQQLLVFAPDQAEAWARLAAIAEADNKLEEAGRCATRALELEPDNLMANLAYARWEVRTGSLEAGAERLERLLDRPLSPVNEAVAAARLGRLLDRLGEPDRAFHACERANRALARRYDVRRAGTGVYSLKAIENLQDFFSTRYRARPVVPRNAGQQAPIFLIGFPRSGTTLLNRILAAHPRLAVLEEKNPLVSVMDRFVHGPEALDRLLALTDEQIEHYRAAYRARVDGLLDGPRDNRCIVDKLPLNAVLVGVIRHFFPEARFILALRDPRDVCLSCFMQTFDINDAMAYMHDLESIGRYYAAVMDLVQLYRDTLPLHLFPIRYEDVVTDMRGTLTQLLDYLHLSWHEGLLNYRRKLKGLHINTPSYAQVSRPLYREAIGRWARYERHLTPIIPLLRPYVERFGYGNGADTECGAGGKND